ncbi:MAG: PucR family transcriptional regulator [Acutalibacteraceae bacterium]
MFNRLFQGIIHQMKDAINRTIGVVDGAGTVVCCSDLTQIGQTNFADMKEVLSGSDIKVIAGKTFLAIGGQNHPDSAIFVDGNDESAASFARLISISLGGIKQYYDVKFDRSNFIKNVILDNILQGDIYLKTRELGFNNDVSRCVLLIRTAERSEISVSESVQALFPDKNKDFVININETDIALVKEVRPGNDVKDLEKLARSIVDSLHTEFYVNSIIGVGSIVTGIKELPRSFKESQIALEVGKVFDTEKTIVTYENLGIARLIYQLPTTLCEIFLKEIFKKGSISGLDHETLFTIQKFFENNLNVSETSRKLFVHRNTLVYRLEKIKKLTGLDLREFDDAIVFKVALMVKKYLDAKPVKY